MSAKPDGCPNMGELDCKFGPLLPAFPVKAAAGCKGQSAVQKSESLPGQKLAH